MSSTEDASVADCESVNAAGVAVPCAAVSDRRFELAVEDVSPDKLDPFFIFGPGFCLSDPSLL